MKFRMIDGHTYSGKSYKAVVANMAGDKLRRPHTLASYREGVAARVKDALDVDIETKNDALFIASMELSGLMERVK